MWDKKNLQESTSLRYKTEFKIDASPELSLNPASMTFYEGKARLRMDGCRSKKRCRPN